LIDAILAKTSNLCITSKIIVIIPGEKMFEGIFQPVHLLILLGIVLLVFGPKKLPELGKGLGEAIRGFKQGMNESEFQKQIGQSRTDPDNQKEHRQ